MIENDLLTVFTKQIDHQCALSAGIAIEFHIALSGGVDSVVLLHLAARLRKNYSHFSLCAHHVNHGLSSHAKEWQAFCQRICDQLQVDFTCSRVHLVKQSRTSLEALAREKRYACLSQSLSKHSYLLTAHHQDDQLETVLLALKRGAGNTGLQGIRSKQKLAQGYLIRPLLNISRQQLEIYANAFDLQWIEDESNADQVFDRNYIRHTIAPLLKARWPSFAKTVTRSAAICQEQQLLLDEIAVLDFSHCLVSLLNQDVLSITQLNLLSSARRNNVLRYWFKENNLNYPSQKQLAVLCSDLISAGCNASPKMDFKELTVRRYRDHLYLLDKNSLDRSSCQPITWSGESCLSLLDGKVNLKFSRLKIKPDNGIFLTLRADSEVKVCFRQHLAAKLRCTPIGRSGSRSINKLLHEYHVAPWLRDCVPFIFIDGELCEAVGLWQCQTLPIVKDCHYLTVSFA